MQAEDGSGHCGARIAGANHSAAGGIDVILWNHQASGLGGRGKLGGAAGGDEGKIGWAGIFKSGDAAEVVFAIAFKGSLEVGGKFLNAHVFKGNVS